MPLLVLGLNHRTAPVEVRERIVFDASLLPVALAELRALPGVQECLIVSTCNRTELYCVLDGASDAPRGWLEQARGGRLDLRDCLYELQGADAVRHAYGVGSGLDSLILGEPQILGQLKDAYRAAHDCATAGALLNRLFQSTFAVAKRVRTETAIGASAVSVASAAVSLARRIFSGFGQHTALLVGAGEMIELSARHLRAQGIGQLIIANRSPEHARRIADRYQAAAISLEALDQHLPQADILISSTASPQHVVHYDPTCAAIAARKRRPMFMVDIAVPRDIDPRIGELEDVYLYTIDDLRQVVEENLRSRQQEADAARQLIAVEVARFMDSLKTLQAVPAIRELRDRADAARQQTLEQARRMLDAGRPASEALEFLAGTLTNRLLHGPLRSLREAAERGVADPLQGTGVPDDQGDVDP